jgi:hypothetical protein
VKDSVVCSVQDLGDCSVPVTALNWEKRKEEHWEHCSRLAELMAQVTEPQKASLRLLVLQKVQR